MEASLGTMQLCVRDDHGAVACRLMSNAHVFHPIDTAATQIASSWNTGCARMADATVRCWHFGAYSTGRAGADAFMYFPPVPAFAGPVATVAHVATGTERGYALDANGYVTAWQLSQASDGLNQPAHGVNGAPQMLSGGGGNTTLAANETLVAWLDAAGTMHAQADDQNGVLAAWFDAQRSIPGMPPARALGVSPTSYCIIDRDDARVWCIGYFGVGFTFDHRYGAMPMLDGAVELALGIHHACARMPDGTVRCTGMNEHGQLGDGTTTRHMDDAVTVAGLDHVDQILAGNQGPATDPPNIEFGFTCARRGSEIRCWGSFADAPDGPLVDHLMPTTITS